MGEKDIYFCSIYLVVMTSSYVYIVHGLQKEEREAHAFVHTCAHFFFLYPTASGVKAADFQFIFTGNPVLEQCSCGYLIELNPCNKDNRLHFAGTVHTKHVVHVYKINFTPTQRKTVTWPMRSLNDVFFSNNDWLDTDAAPIVGVKVDRYRIKKGLSLFVILPLMHS